MTSDYNQEPEKRGRPMSLDKDQLKEKLKEILTEPMATKKICVECGYHPNYMPKMLKRLFDFEKDGFLSLYEKVRGPKSTHRFWSIAGKSDVN
jgi:hypothetical protein